MNRRQLLGTATAVAGALPAHRLFGARAVLVASKRVFAA